MWGPRELNRCPNPANRVRAHDGYFVAENGLDDGNAVKVGPIVRVLNRSSRVRDSSSRRAIVIIVTDYVTKSRRRGKRAVRLPSTHEDDAALWKSR